EYSRKKSSHISRSDTNSLLYKFDDDTNRYEMQGSTIVQTLNEDSFIKDLVTFPQEHVNFQKTLDEIN
ncbi:MAG: hypothetical protein ACRENO_02705, partial [Thermodesulfobacteriota bacterium]